MHRRHWFAAFTMIVLVVASATPARAEKPGPFEFTLAGSGSSDKDFDATQFAAIWGSAFIWGRSFSVRGRR